MVLMERENLLMPPRLAIKNPYSYSEATDASEANSPVCGLKMKGAGGKQLDIKNLSPNSLIAVSCGESDDAVVCSYRDKDMKKAAAAGPRKASSTMGDMLYIALNRFFSSR